MSKKRAESRICRVVPKQQCSYRHLNRPEYVPAHRVTPNKLAEFIPRHRRQSVLQIEDRNSWFDVMVGEDNSACGAVEDTHVDAVFALAYRDVESSRTFWRLEQ
jgi:hypothetical protein